MGLLSLALSPPRGGEGKGKPRGWQWPEGDSGDVADINARRRLELIYDFQTTDAMEFGRWKMGQDPEVLGAFPSQEFLRIEARRVRREDWPARWVLAAQQSGDQAALAVQRFVSTELLGVVNLLRAISGSSKRAVL